MSEVLELRVALTVDDFDGAVAFYRDALGLHQLADWSSRTGQVVLPGGGAGDARATGRGAGGHR